jgi:hypothetical protein
MQRFVACYETIDEYQLSKQRFCCLDLGCAAGKSFLNLLLDRLRIESKQRLVNSYRVTKGGKIQVFVA